jgi:hypothetical protein
VDDKVEERNHLVFLKWNVGLSSPISRFLAPDFSETTCDKELTRHFVRLDALLSESRI